jgi:hypothetical protein
MIVMATVTVNPQARSHFAGAGKNDKNYVDHESSMVISNRSPPDGF